MSEIVTVAEVSIRQDAEGRYNLNDLHRAAGGHARHRPNYWLVQQQTKELAEEVEKAGIPAIYSKRGVGTYVVKEMVYAYAMWISPAFHVKVIRAYDMMVSAPKEKATKLSTVWDRYPLYGFAVDTVLRHHLLFSRVYLLLNLFAGSRRFKEMTKEQVSEVIEFCDRFAISQDTRADWQRIQSNQVKMYGEQRQLDMVQQLLIK